MRRADLVELIPKALGELHTAGISWVYYEDLAQQVTLHDETYLKRRARIRGVLSHLGVEYPALPTPGYHPDHLRMGLALDQLEAEGAIVSEIEPDRRADGEPRRNIFSLPDPSELQLPQQRAEEPLDTVQP